MNKIDWTKKYLDELAKDSQKVKQIRKREQESEADMWRRIAERTSDNHAITRALLDWIWANCSVLHWPKDNSYPLEHQPLAGKDMRDYIEAEFFKQQP
jgi:hypothetical protein